MTLYDFFVCTIHKLTIYVDWINIIDYKKGENFSILRNENTNCWEYSTIFIAQYKILHIIAENNENSVVLNIIVEKINNKN